MIFSDVTNCVATKQMRSLNISYPYYKNMNPAPVTTKKSPFERLGPSIYRKGGTINARVRVNGKLTWRSTGTNEPREARAWVRKWKKDEFFMKSGIEPQGIILQRQRTTVQQIIDAYIKAGCPKRNMQPKASYTLKNERYFLNPIRVYFGQMAAASLTLADCDKYLDSRTSGGYVSKFLVRGKPQTMVTKGGKRSVDMELGILGNALSLATRQGILKSNPLDGRGRYGSASEVRHCREVAPSQDGLVKIERWLRNSDKNTVADIVCFMGYSGLRVGEALKIEWCMVNWSDKILNVQREKKGILPWVPILPEMEALLQNMRSRATSHLLFPSPFNPKKTANYSSLRRWLARACQELEIGHVTAHGMRSYFVTQARQSSFSDAEIAMLIGDKTGPSIIAFVYGDVRPEWLLKQAQKIRLTASQPNDLVGKKQEESGEPAAASVGG